MSKINILYLENSSGYGGSSSNLYHILKKLDKKKYHPIVLIHEDGPNFKKIRSLKIKVIKVPFWGANVFYNGNQLVLLLIFIPIVIPLIIKFKKIIQDKKISLVHINTNIFMGIPMIIAAKLMRKPVVCYIRQTRKLITREKLFAPLANRFLVLNKKAVQIYKNDIPAKKIELLHDGIDIEEFQGVQTGKFRDEHNLNSLILVGLVGRIVEGKGHLEFIKAAKHLCLIRDDVRFVIVGDVKGGEEDYCQKVHSLVVELGLQDKFIFTGWRTDIREILTDINVLTLPTTTFPEGLPNIIIEAMALRKSVVATNVPGIAELVSDGETGFVVPPGQIKPLAERILYLCGNPHRAEEMGNKGKERVEEMFNVKNVVIELGRMYEEVLEKKA